MDARMMGRDDMTAVRSIRDLIDPHSGYCFIAFGSGAVPVRWRRAESDVLFVDAVAAVAVRKEVEGYFVARDGLGIVHFTAVVDSENVDASDGGMFDVLPLRLDLSKATLANRRSFYRLAVPETMIVLRRPDGTPMEATLVNLSAGGIGVLGSVEYFQEHLLNQCELTIPNSPDSLHVSAVFVAQHAQLHTADDGQTSTRNVLGFEFVAPAAQDTLPTGMHAISEAQQTKILQKINHMQTDARRRRRTE